MNILRLDSSGGLGVGVVVLALHPWLSGLYGLGPRLVMLMGAANLVYGCYSGALVLRASKVGGLPRLAVDALIGGNLAWVAVCMVLVATHGSTASWLGVAHLVLEALVVGSLAVAELRLVRPETGRLPA